MAVDSFPGEVSTCRFDVLLRHARPDSQSANAATPERCEPRRLRVLVVEDNATNRLVASRMIERMGHRVDAVTEGSEALQAVRSVPYDLILMDVMMPGMDGLTATRLIRSDTAIASRTPIIGLTANAAWSDEVACREAGMDGFVTKPVTAGHLAAAIEAVLHPREPAILDETVLSALATDIGADGLLEVVRLFLAEAPVVLDRLAAASATGGRDLLHEVHALASAARNVGLLRAGFTAAAVEAELATRDVKQARLDGLQSLLREGVARLTAWEAGTRR